MVLVLGDAVVVYLLRVSWLQKVMHVFVFVAVSGRLDDAGRLVKLPPEASGEGLEGLEHLEHERLEQTTDHSMQLRSIMQDAVRTGPPAL